MTNHPELTPQVDKDWYKQMDETKWKFWRERGCINLEYDLPQAMIVPRRPISISKKGGK